MDLKDLTIEELEGKMEELGFERFRARQIAKWLYQKGEYRFDRMTDLPLRLRRLLEEHFSGSSLYLEKVEVSSDGTKKLCFLLEDGGRIETVLIPEETHWTICTSTQAGCPLGCSFCATGKSGYIRNLRPGEIVEQIITARRLLEGNTSFNVVFMGMGEPLLNYSNLIKVLNNITSPQGCAISARRITVSTVGILPEMELIARNTKVGIAISLNSPTDELRDKLMPINRRFPIGRILEVARKIISTTHRTITIEYVLLRAVNDSVEDGRKLAQRLKGMNVKINLIPYNPFPGSEFKRPEEKRVLAFQQELIQRGYLTFIRKSRGLDIAAACGQLALK